MFKKIITVSVDQQYYVKALDRFIPLKPFAKPSTRIIYFHVLGPNFFTEYSDLLPLLDGIEVKPGNFKKHGAPLFKWDAGQYKVIQPAMDSLAEQAQRADLAMQFHFPNRINTHLEESLSTAAMQHHERLLEVFSTYSDVVRDYGFMPNVTVHPPLLKRQDHLSRIKVDKALRQANQFFIKLGKTLAAQDSPIIVGIENQTDITAEAADANNLGYETRHLTRLAANTNHHIQFTVDRGHRNLSTGFKVNDLVQWCAEHNKYIANFHFHGNEGTNQDLQTIVIGASTREQSKIMADIPGQARWDAHMLPKRWQASGYSAYILRAVKEGIPLDLELSARKIDRAYGRETLLNYIKQLREEVNLAYSIVQP